MPLEAPGIDTYLKRKPPYEATFFKASGMFIGTFAYATNLAITLDLEYQSRHLILSIIALTQKFHT